LLKRFRGSEEKFVTYLAVIAESVVRDSFRKALRRPNGQRGCSERVLDFAEREGANGGGKVAPVAEQHVLAREVWSISLRTIKNLSGSLYARDTKTAVEKVLSRVKNRVRAAIAAKGRPEERRE